MRLFEQYVSWGVREVSLRVVVYSDGDDDLLFDYIPEWEVIWGTGWAQSPTREWECCSYLNRVEDDHESI